MDVVVTGIGLVSALGESLTTSWQRLTWAESGVFYHQPFPELKPRPLALVGKVPAQLKSLIHLVVSAALKEAGLVPPLPGCAVVIGSSRSHQASWEQLGQQLYLQPADALQEVDWLATLPHMVAVTAAQQIGADGAVLAPMAACATGIWAIAQGFELIQSGQYQRVLVGAVEAPVTPLTLTGFAQMGALAKTGAYPFDCQREGFVLGEGGAVFVLESAELAKQRSAQVYGYLLGFGLTSDGYHITTPDPDSGGAIRAVKQCLKRSQLAPADIDYVHSHGTATVLNDQQEAKLLQKLFTQGVPVSSTKGATGHTLGASGALGVAFCLMALKHQLLPPCVGLKTPAFDLDFVTTPRSSKIQRTLCFSFGFGGQNAVVAIGSETNLSKPR